MIPRFIIRNVTSNLVTKLTDMGYEAVDGNIIGDALVLGRHIMNNPPERNDNPLLKRFDARHHEKEILDLAQLQIRWQATAKKVELMLGDPKQGKVVITKLGVLIDSCLVPITQFHQLEQQLLGFKSPFIVTHDPIIDKKKPFLVVGCATYSMEDISTILTTYYSLS